MIEPLKPINEKVETLQSRDDFIYHGRCTVTAEVKLVVQVEIDADESDGMTRPEMADHVADHIRAKGMTVLGDKPADSQNVGVQIGTIR